MLRALLLASSDLDATDPDGNEVRVGSPAR
jgi:hypothetical protein